jgi:hypothetical protein
LSEVGTRYSNFSTVTTFSLLLDVFFFLYVLDSFGYMIPLDLETYFLSDSSCRLSTSSDILTDCFRCLGYSSSLLDLPFRLSLFILKKFFL